MEPIPLTRIQDFGWLQTFKVFVVCVDTYRALGSQYCCQVSNPDLMARSAPSATPQFCSVGISFMEKKAHLLFGLLVSETAYLQWSHQEHPILRSVFRMKGFLCLGCKYGDRCESSVQCSEGCLSFQRPMNFTALCRMAVSGATNLEMLEIK